MISSWEKFEELIKAEMRKVFSETTIDHSMNPRNVGNLKDADGFARVTGPCGDTMEIWLKVKDGTIAQATFYTDGCGTTLASGSMVTEMVKGKKHYRGLEDWPAGRLKCFRRAAGGKQTLCPSGSRYAEGSDKRLPGDGKGAIKKAYRKR